MGEIRLRPWYPFPCGHHRDLNNVDSRGGCRACFNTRMREYMRRKRADNPKYGRTRKKTVQEVVIPSDGFCRQQRLGLGDGDGDHDLLRRGRGIGDGDRPGFGGGRGAADGDSGAADAGRHVR